MRRAELNLAFVTAMPGTLEEGTLYISMTYGTALHKCCCGCGQEVVTPFSPTDWTLQFDGEHITLDPSIGNWSFPCQSHYWIKRNHVIWAEHWDSQTIQYGKKADREAKQQHYGKPHGHTSGVKPGTRRGLWATLTNWLCGRQ